MTSCSRPSRLVIAGLAAVALSVVVAPGASSAIERVIDDGPVSGSEYDLTHSCLAEAANWIRRDRSTGVPIETTTKTFDEAGRPRAGASAFFGTFTSPDSLFTGRRGFLGDAGAVAVFERLAGEADFVEVVRTSWDCPDVRDQPASVFVPISPTRVLDTRPEFAINHVGPRPGGGTEIEITPAMMPALPDDVVAVSTNVGIVGSDGGGFAQVLPTGQTPGTSSSVNTSERFQDVLNLAVSPTGTGGSVSVYTSSPAHLTVDINGYFVASDGPERAGRAVTVDPDRVFDSRDTRNSQIAGGTITTVDLAAASALPAAEASAAIVNITAEKTGGGPGFVQGAATGELVPGRSAVLNVLTGDDTVAALAILPVTDGSIDLFTSGRTHMIVDVLGWFTNDTVEASTSGRFTPLEPERLFDSRIESAVNYTAANFPGQTPDESRFADDFRTGARAANTFTDLEMRGIEGDEDRGQRPVASSIFANIVLVESTAAGYLQAGELGGVVPGASSNVNAAGPAETVANAAIVPFSETDSDVTRKADGITIYSASGGQIVVDVVGFFTL